MSRLFTCLDKAVSANASLIEEAVEDKAYMAQLIEIQHMRGVVGGDIFYKLLTKSLPPKPEGSACVMVFSCRNMLSMVCLFLCVGTCFSWCVWFLLRLGRVNLRKWD